MLQIGCKLIGISDINLFILHFFKVDCKVYKGK